MVLSVNRAQACSYPVEIAIAPLRLFIIIGAVEFVMVPFPNWPLSLYPQHFTVPSVNRAQVKPLPAEIAVASLRPFTATGVDELTVVPFPNSPE